MKNVEYTFLDLNQTLGKTSILNPVWRKTSFKDFGVDEWNPTTVKDFLIRLKKDPALMRKWQLNRIGFDEQNGYDQMMEIQRTNGHYEPWNGNYKYLCFTRFLLKHDADTCKSNLKP